MAAVLACRRRAWLSERTTLSILLVVFALVLTYTDWLWRWDQVFYDCSLRSWYRAPAQDIVIVAIDERSLRELGRWPWSRRVHAELVDKLTTAGAKVVALNIVFAEPAALDPAADVVLAAAIERSSRVILPVLNEHLESGGQLIETFAHPYAG